MSSIRQESKNGVQTSESTVTEIIFDKGTLSIILRGVVGVATVKKLFDDINEFIDDGLECISVDPSGAKGFDTTSVQLLIALIDYSKTYGLAYKWLSSNERLTEVAGFLGLKSNLELVD